MEKEQLPMENSFLCLGLIMRDILIRGVDTLPQHWEQTLVARGIRSDTGGGAANSARTLGRLGAKVSLSGRLGDEDFGRAIRADLAADHVDTTPLRSDPEEPSGVAVGLVREDGKRCFITVRGAGSRYCAADLADIPWSSYPYVHINGYFQFPALEPDLPALLERARAAGCVISFDTASWDASGRWFESIRPFAKYIDYFFANDAQLAQLTHCARPEEAARFLLSQGVGNVIAKLGGSGSISFGADGSAVSAAAYPIRAVDTTGAGDSFDAAYMLGVSLGWDTRSCAEFANTVAGLNCTRLGATAGVPDFKTALRLARENYR